MWVTRLAEENAEPALPLWWRLPSEDVGAGGDSLMGCVADVACCACLRGELATLMLGEW